MKTTERKKRRAYLQDFVKGADGDYGYVGTSYAYAGASRRDFLVRIAVCAVLAAASLFLEGTVRAPGMDHSPFVLLPYAASVVALLLLLWPAAGLLLTGDPVREYRYQRYVEPMMRRGAAFAVCEGLCAAGEIVCIALGGIGDMLGAAVGFFALCAVGAAAAVFLGRTVRTAAWKRIEKSFIDP